MTTAEMVLAAARSEPTIDYPCEGRTFDHGHLSVDIRTNRDKDTMRTLFFYGTKGRISRAKADALLSIDPSGKTWIADRA